MSNQAPRKRRATKLVLGALVALAGTTQGVTTEAVSAAPAVDLTYPIDWSRDPGVQDQIADLTPSQEIALADFGAVANDNVDDRPALVAAIQHAQTRGGAVINLPSGVLHVNGGVDLADGVVIRGAGSDSTRVVFTASGDHGFQIGGGYPQRPGPNAPATVTTAVSGQIGSTRLVVANGEALQPGMLAVLSVGDQTRPSDRAGQVVEIVSTRPTGTGNQAELVTEEELSDDVAGFTVAGFTPIRGAGIEDLTLGPAAGIAVTHLIMLRGSADSWVTGVESSDALKAHVMIRYSYHCEVSGNGFSDALSHGDGGRGYGVNIANRTTGCLIEGNEFELLRHSILLQDGAVGNVVAFNRSSNPRHINFTDGGPADISFHGYAVANLVEGNVVERIQLTDAGVPGPFNTILRNCLTSGPLTLDGPTRHERLIGNAMFGSNEALRSRLMPAFETLSNPRPFLKYGDVFDDDGVLVLQESESLVLHQNWYQGRRSGSDLGSNEPIPSTLYGSSFAPILDNPSAVNDQCQAVAEPHQDPEEPPTPRDPESVGPPVLPPVPHQEPPHEEPPGEEPPHEETPGQDQTDDDQPTQGPPEDEPSLDEIATEVLPPEDGSLADVPPDILPFREPVEDTVAPQATVEASVGRGRNAGRVVVSGVATDDLAIDYVRVAVVDRSTGRYLQDDLTSFGSEHFMEIAVDADATFELSPLRLADGHYGITVQAVDIAGNVQAVPESTSILVAWIKARGLVQRFELANHGPR